MAVTKIPCGKNTVGQYNRALEIALCQSDLFKVSAGETYTANGTTYPFIAGVYCVESCTFSAISAGAVSLISSSVTYEPTGSIYSLPNATTTITVSSGSCLVVPVINATAS